MHVPSTLHQQASAQREQGQTSEALQTYAAAMTEYTAAQNLEGVVRVLLEQDLCWKHFYQTDMENTLYLQHRTMACSLADAIREQQPLPFALQSLIAFHMAQLSEDAGDLESAQSEYLQALLHAKVNEPQRANILLHLAPVEWALEEHGRSRQTWQQGMELLERTNGDLELYTHQVWLSGAHLRWAEAVAEDDLNEAKKHLQLAHEIIDSNPNLVLRRQQWERLNEELSTPQQ